MINRVDGNCEFHEGDPINLESSETLFTNHATLHPPTKGVLKLNVDGLLKTNRNLRALAGSFEILNERC